MSYYVAVQVPSPSLTKKPRTLAFQPLRSRKEARAWIRTNRETFRAALEHDEARVLAIVLNDRMRAVEATEFDRTWGSPGETHGRDTVRAMIRALRNDPKTTGDQHE